jgi:hypothetical protein
MAWRLIMTLFEIYRRFLLVALVAYTVMQTARFAVAWVQARQDGSRHQRLFQTYMEYQFVRARMAPFRRDLLEIAGLAIVLGLLIWLHPGNPGPLH